MKYKKEEDMSILVITNKIDPHSDEVIKILQSKKAEVFRLNTEDFCTNIETTLRIDNGHFDGKFKSKLREIEFSKIKSVLYRRPKKTEARHIQNDHYRNFVESECWFYLNWLWEALPCFWISKPSSIRKAESKIKQLTIANQFGFTIPKTLITTNPEEARCFYRECGGNVVNKVLGTGFIEDQGSIKTIYTHRINDTDLGHAESIQCVPCVFQERIEKKFELRITVVGKKVFAAEIHSQNSPRTKDDWRRYDLENTPHFPHKLPEQIQKACVEFVSYYGLAFGAIDMIVTPKNEYIFLELNPNGQWLWIERLTNLPISEAIADLLINSNL